MFGLNIFVRLLTFLLIFDLVWCNIKISRIFNIYIFSAERRAEMEMEIDSADTSQDIVPAPDVPDFQPVKNNSRHFQEKLNVNVDGLEMNNFGKRGLFSLRKWINILRVPIPGLLENFTTLESRNKEKTILKCMSNRLQ